MESPSWKGDDDDYRQMPVLSPQVPYYPQSPLKHRYVTETDQEPTSTTTIVGQKRKRSTSNSVTQSKTGQDKHIDKSDDSGIVDCVDLPTETPNSPVASTAVPMDDDDSSRSPSSASAASTLELESGETWSEDDSESAESNSEVPCPHCPAVLRSNVVLNEHLRRHTGSRSKYCCEFCTYSVSQERSMRRHRKVHFTAAAGTRRVEPGPSRHRSPEPCSSSVRKAESKSPVNHTKASRKLRKKSTECRTGRNIILPQRPRYTFSSEDEDSDIIDITPGRHNKSKRKKNRSRTEESEDDDSSIVAEHQSRNLDDETRQRPVQNFQIEIPVASARASDYVDVETESTSQKNYLVTGLKVVNFMCFKKKTLTVPSLSNAITVTGDQWHGKSASLVALLIGLGYDLMSSLTASESPKLLFGVALTSESLVSTESSESKVQITLALHSVPKLRARYGDKIRLIRRIYRDQPLGFSKFEIRSLDPTSFFPRFPAEVSFSQVRFILATLKLTKLNSRLMVLDAENLNEFQDNTGSWYDYYNQPIRLRGRELHKKLNELEHRALRIEGVSNCKKVMRNMLRTQVKASYPKWDAELVELYKDDEQKIAVLELEIQELTEKCNDLQAQIQVLINELNDLPAVYAKRMRDVYQAFLEKTNCTGSVIIDDTTKRLGIWVRSLGSTEDEEPTDVDEAEIIWRGQPFGKRRASAMALFLAFWEIDEVSPLFALDSTSSDDFAFHVPPRCMSVVIGIISRKERISDQQFCLTLPSTAKNNS